MMCLNSNEMHEELLKFNGSDAFVVKVESFVALLELPSVLIVTEKSQP